MTGVYEVYINDDPGLTSTYFTARSNLVAYVCEWGNYYNVILKMIKLAGNDKIDRIFLFMKRFDPRELSAPAHSPVPGLHTYK